MSRPRIASGSLTAAVVLPAAAGRLPGFPDESGHRRLALAYPAEHFRLDLTRDEIAPILHAP
ncbi:hypothetical protein [Streptomyces pseudovenezuelae]|uniref:hypothetical protein n=1 Tax=Streptomyces pseudovenezuelae TaxID=67350 RepID=UPI002E7FD2FE|nr:hypothetical protein [Streptomyces pseudovenezuelae]WUA87485.1 hypothetical protein OHO81_09370 [Streptomyces pseudovenezuelae]